MRRRPSSNVRLVRRVPGTEMYVPSWAYEEVARPLDLVTPLHPGAFKLTLHRRLNAIMRERISTHELA